MAGPVSINNRTAPKSGLDYFPTPPWATRALLEWLKQREALEGMSVWEPACGGGHMARPLAEYFAKVHATDIADYSDEFPGQDGICDFVLDWPGGDMPDADWIITNPPFNVGNTFAELALTRARRGVAFIVRAQFLESKGRYFGLWRDTPPSDVLQMVERVPMCAGKVDPNVATNQTYIWVVWRIESMGHTRLHWIPPCRRTLERPSDYPAEAIEVADAGPLFGED